MCGRYKQAAAAQKLREMFDLGTEGAADFIPAGLVLPGQTAPVVRRHGESNRLDALRWGLTPHWAKEAKGSRFINARSESMAEKPSFRDAFKTRRCLIPADGFYEWDARQTPKSPYYIGLENAAPFAFAGLWDTWTNPETGETIDRFAIITTAATDALQGCHDRMPVMLTSGKAFQFWLSPATPLDVLQKMTAPRAEITLALSPATDLPPSRAESQADHRQGSLF